MVFKIQVRSGKMSQKSPFDSGDERPKIPSMPESATGKSSGSGQIEREANTRLGDQFKELGKIDKAILCYKKAQNGRKLAQIRQEILISGDLRMAEFIAVHSGQPLKKHEYEKLADNAFLDRTKVQNGYIALERAGYSVNSVDGMSDYSVFWNGESTDLSRQARRVFNLGGVYEKSGKWYEAIRRYEDAIYYSKRTDNAGLINSTYARLTVIGRKCMEANLLYCAFCAFRVAGATEDLKKLSRMALFARPRMESLAFWIHEELALLNIRA